VTRFRNVIDEYQTTTHTPEALMRLTESYLALGVPEEARKSAAVLGANYPGTEWYQRAYQLVQRHAPAAQQTAAVTRAAAERSRGLWSPGREAGPELVEARSFLFKGRRTC
jgi:hypothetical protein